MYSTCSLSFSSFIPPSLSQAAGAADAPRQDPGQREAAGHLQEEGRRHLQEEGLVSRRRAAATTTTTQLIVLQLIFGFLSCPFFCFWVSAFAQSSYVVESLLLYYCVTLK